MMFTNCEIQNKTHLIWHNKCQGFFLAQIISSFRWASSLNPKPISFNQFCSITTRNMGPVIKCTISSRSETTFPPFKIRIVLGFTTLKNCLCYQLQWFFLTANVIAKNYIVQAFLDLRC